MENGALVAVRELQTSSAVAAIQKLETTGVFATVREFQNTLNAMKPSMDAATAAFEEYNKSVAPILDTINAINRAYAPIFEQIKTFDTLHIKGIISGLQTSVATMRAISELNISEIIGVIDTISKYDFLSDIFLNDFSVDVAEELYESGEITQDDINEEITEIINKKQFSPKATWDKFKKSKWFTAFSILMFIVAFACQPVKEYVSDKARDCLGITEFWKKSECMIGSIQCLKI